MASTMALSSFNLQLKGIDRSIQTRTKSMIRISCCSSSYSNNSISADPYKILGIQPWASMPQVKKAFRKLAKQYHPDVCKEKDCGVQFEEINAAYEAVMEGLRGKSSAYGNNNKEAMGMKNDPFSTFHEGSNNDHVKGRTQRHWDYRDEWIGWEVGNWMFYRDQHDEEGEEDDDETTFEESNKEDGNI